jgi:DMSO reductase anchor subunit
VGIIAALLCICTVYATSMIYASLRTIHHWYSWVTSACYLGFAASSGYMLLAAISPEFLQMRHAANIAIGLLAIVWIVKGIWWHRADTTASASTPETALGLPSDSNPRRLELPHTGSNYLLAEMGHKVARKHVHKLRIIAIVFGFLLPVVCLFAAGQVDDTLAQAMAILAAASHYFGIVVERWLFFAEARHTVMLYYGAEAA